MSQEEFNEARDQKEVLNLEEMADLMFYQAEKGNKKIKETFKGLVNKLDRAGFEDILQDAVVKLIEENGEYLRTNSKRKDMETERLTKESFGLGKDKEKGNIPTRVGKLHFPF